MWERDPLELWGGFSTRLQKPRFRDIFPVWKPSIRIGFMRLALYLGNCEYVQIKVSANSPDLPLQNFVGHDFFRTTIYGYHKPLILSSRGRVYVEAIPRIPPGMSLSTRLVDTDFSMLSYSRCLNARIA